MSITTRQQGLARLYLSIRDKKQEAVIVILCPSYLVFVSVCSICRQSGQIKLSRFGGDFKIDFRTFPVSLNTMKQSNKLHRIGTNWFWASDSISILCRMSLKVHESCRGAVSISVVQVFVTFSFLGRNCVSMLLTRLRDSLQGIKH